MSLVYHQGNRAAAIAAIASAVNTFDIKEMADGSKYLDIADLTRWLQTQFESISTSDAPAVTYPLGALAAARTVDFGPATAQLARVISPENWRASPFWPSPASTSRPNVLKAKQATLKSASDALSLHFSQLGDDKKLLELCRSVFTDMETALPEPKDRIIENRVYIQTFVTDRGEESAPSKPSPLAEVDQDDTIRVNLAWPTPGRNITKWRLYRSNSGSQAAAYQFVDEGIAGQSFYDDAKKNEELQEPCPTTTWLEPPTNLRGMTGMPNGVLAGFFDSTVAFCEPYQPHAWPAEYQIVLEFPIVGMAAFDQTLFVGTRSQPYFISGADSASMSAQKLNTNQACVSAQSLVAVQGGVLFASPDGMCLASNNGIDVVTDQHFTREDWQALAPESIVAAEHEGVCYIFWRNGGTSGCYSLHLPSRRMTRLSMSGTAAFVDRINDRLYLLATDGAIHSMFSSSERRTAIWRGRVEKLLPYAGFAWIQVDSDFTSPVTVRLYADDAHFFTVVLNDHTPRRLPPGRHQTWEVEVESAARVTMVTLASSTEELKAV